MWVEALVGDIISVLAERPKTCCCALFSRGVSRCLAFANFEWSQYRCPLGLEIWALMKGQYLS